MSRNLCVIILLCKCSLVSICIYNVVFCLFDNQSVLSLYASRMSVAFRSHKLTAQGNRQVRPCYSLGGGGGGSNSTYYMTDTCHFARKIGTHNSGNSGGF